MFKPLIKKVKEESSNSSTLPANHSSEINDGSNRDVRLSTDDEDSTSPRVHGRVDSDKLNNSRLSSISTESDIKEESFKLTSDIVSPSLEESTSTDSFVQLRQSWIDSNEQLLQQKDETIERLKQEKLILENEVILFKNKLADLQNFEERNTTDNTIKIPHLQKQVDTLRSDNENLKLTIKSLRTQLSEVEAERDDLLIKSTDDLQRQFDQQKLELETVRQALIERDAIIEQQDKRLLVDHNTQAIQTDDDKSFVQVLAEPDVDTISKLQTELDEKNRTVKNLQQRYNDLRKTLQREFHASIPKDLNQMSSSKSISNTPASPTNLPLIHYDASTTSQSDVDVAKRASTVRQMTAVRKNVTFTTATGPTSPAILPHTSFDLNSTRPQTNGHHASNEGQNNLNGTNFKYLKHVLLKFMTSTEDEAIHLIRAVSTLLSFSADEERLIRETLDYKMSWFGKVSRVKPLPSNAPF